MSRRKTYIDVGVLIAAARGENEVAVRSFMSINTEATIEDLYRVPENGKAEIVNGKLVLMSPTGFMPGRAGGEIYASLRDYERRTKSGYALPDNTDAIAAKRRDYFAAGTLVVWDVDVLQAEVVRATNTSGFRLLPAQLILDGNNCI